MPLSAPSLFQLLSTVRISVFDTREEPLPWPKGAVSTSETNNAQVWVPCRHFTGLGIYPEVSRNQHRAG